MRRTKSKLLFHFCIPLLISGIVILCCGCSNGAGARPDTDSAAVLANLYLGGALNSCRDTAYFLDDGNSPGFSGEPDSLYRFGVDALEGGTAGGLDSTLIATQVSAFFPTESAVYFGKRSGGIYAYTIADQQTQQLSDKACTDIVVRDARVFFRSDDRLYTMTIRGTDLEVIDVYHKAHNLWPTEDALYFISGGDDPDQVYRYRYGADAAAPVEGLYAKRLLVVEDRLYYVEATDSELEQNLFLYDLTSGEMRQLTEGKYIQPTALNLYNGYLIYSDVKAFQVIAMDLRSGKETLLASQNCALMTVCGDALISEKGILQLNELK